MKKLRVGFLVDDLTVRKYQFEIIESVREDFTTFNTPIIIHGYRSEISASDNTFIKFRLRLRNSNIFQLLNWLLFHVLIRFIQRVETKNALKYRPEYIERVSLLSQPIYHLAQIQGEYSKSGKYLSLTKSDLELMRELKLDLIVRFGSGILTGEILTLPTFGVISFHHGDNRVNRGTPSGFWEVLNSDPSTGFVIQRLNNELDGGDILYRGNIMTASTWILNHANVQFKSAPFMTKILKEIGTRNGLPPFEVPYFHDKPLRKLDAKSQLLVKYVWRIWIPILWERVRGNLIGKRRAWHVAYTTSENYKTSLWRFKEILNPQGYFFADPFIMTHEGSSVIFVESYSKLKRRGEIWAIGISENGYEILGAVISEEFHLSFPFVFRSEGEIYMVPDSSNIGEIRLYKCVNFPNKWVFHSTLMAGVSAADTILVEKEDYWYMLTNICSAGSIDHNSELHIFYSNSLLSSEWKPIGMGNPVLFDSERARNAGLFHHEGRIYRVNQVHGKNHYGKAIGVNQIISLDKLGYSEIQIQRVSADFKKNINSIHHFHSDGNYSVLDYMKLS